MAIRSPQSKIMQKYRFVEVFVQPCRGGPPCPPGDFVKQSHIAVGDIPFGNPEIANNFRRAGMEARPYSGICRVVALPSVLCDDTHRTLHELSAATRRLAKPEFEEHFLIKSKQKMEFRTNAEFHLPISIIRKGYLTYITFLPGKLSPEAFPSEGGGYVDRLSFFLYAPSSGGAKAGVR